MGIKIIDTTPTPSVLVLVKYRDALGTAIVTKGWA